jgi:hypothetical protein
LHRFSSIKLVMRAAPQSRACQKSDGGTGKNVAGIVRAGAETLQGRQKCR